MKKLLAGLIMLWGGGAAGLWYWNELNAQHVAFLRAPIANEGKCGGKHADRTYRDSHPMRLVLSGDVNHPGRAAFVEVGQFFRHN